MKIFLTHIKEVKEILEVVKTDDVFLASVTAAEQLLHKALLGGNKLLIAGNGGSAADAQHFAAEIISRYKTERKSFPALALTTDSSIVTAIGNDYSFEKIFSRQIEGHGKEGDVFIGISTSGNSKNILKAVDAARKLNLHVVLLLGGTGGEARGVGDIEIVVPSTDTPHIQEVHEMVMHSLCESFDQVVKNRLL